MGERVRFRGDSIGFVLQGFQRLPVLTASENAAVPLLLRGERRTQALRQARELLARMGLGERTESLPAELSGGQQQRIAIARASVNAPVALVGRFRPRRALNARSGIESIVRIVAAPVREARLLDDRPHFQVTFPDPNMRRRSP